MPSKAPTAPFLLSINQFQSLWISLHMMKEGKHKSRWKLDGRKNVNTRDENASVTIKRGQHDVETTLSKTKNKTYYCIEQPTQVHPPTNPLRANLNEIVQMFGCNSTLVHRSHSNEIREEGSKGWDGVRATRRNTSYCWRLPKSLYFGSPVSASATSG